MNARIYHALVVDDDPIVRKMLEFALGQEGFDCEAVGDGDYALRHLNECSCDLVVSDLRMPNKNGHSLAVELLQGDMPPVVMIHTSVDDPRMTKDLLARGVDDVVYKPCNYATFAARAKVLVEKRAELAMSKTPPAGIVRVAETAKDSQSLDMNKCIESAEVDLGAILPISQAALDVYRLTQQGDTETEKIAATIAFDASLATEILVLANSSHYNPSGEKRLDIEEAVVRIGRRRVGELALAISARASLSQRLVPWIDLDLLWQKSLAAGVAIELALEDESPDAQHEGLFLSAIFNSLGRIVLASVFNEKHAALAQQCAESGELLSYAELNAFGRTQADIMAELLQQWNLPDEVTFPLARSQMPYESLLEFPEKDRRRIELLKLGVTIGSLAVGSWQPWEEIELPADDLPNKLGVRSTAQLIEQTRKGYQAILQMQHSEPAAPPSSGQPLGPRIGYLTLPNGGFDFLGATLKELHMQLECQDLASCDQVIVNCLNMDPTLAGQVIPAGIKQGLLLAVRASQQKHFAGLGPVVTLPTSYARLLDACTSAALAAI